MKIILNHTTISKLILIFFFFSITLGQLQKIPLAVGAIYLHDILLLAYCVTRLKPDLQMIKNIKFHTFHTGMKLGLLAIGFIYIRTIIGAIEFKTIEPLLYLGRLVCYSYFTFSVLHLLGKDLLEKAWLLVIGGFLYLGLLQYIFIPDVRSLAILGWDDHYYRLISTLFDPAFTGLAFVFGILVLLTKNINPVIKLSFISILSLGLTLTYSRSSWLTLVIGLSYSIISCMYKKKTSRNLVSTTTVVIGTMLATFIMAPKPGGEGVNILRTSTIIARQEQSANALSSITLSEAVIGNGLFLPTFESLAHENYHPRVPDNSILMIFTGGGSIALILSIVSILGIIKRNIVEKNNLQNVLLLSLITHSFFSASLIQPFIFLLFLGLYLTSPRHPRPE